MKRLAASAVIVGMAVTLASSTASIRAGTSDRPGAIAFLRLDNNRVFGGRVFVINPDGTDLRGVTPAHTSVFAYAWSRDGSWIAYIDRKLSLWLVRPNGKNRRLLLSTSQLSSVSLTWSPDGKDIAIVSPGSKADLDHTSCGGLDLYIVPLDSGTPKRLPRPRQGFGCDISWSPTGGEIAYGDGPLGIVSTSDGKRRILVKAGVGQPQWSPDGKQLAFAAVYGSAPRVHRYNRLAAVDADGRDYHVITDHAYTEGPFAWSPDSRQILYPKENLEGIYTIGSDGKNDRRLTTDAPQQAGWGALDWSPTGAAIVYAKGVDTNTDLYLLGIDGRHKVHLTTSPDVDIDPSWVL
jgi:Tol biopolymer transport system component